MRAKIKDTQAHLNTANLRPALEQIAGSKHFLGAMFVGSQGD